MTGPHNGLPEGSWLALGSLCVNSKFICYEFFWFSAIFLRSMWCPECKLLHLIQIRPARFTRTIHKNHAYSQYVYPCVCRILEVVLSTAWKSSIGQYREQIPSISLVERFNHESPHNESFVLCIQVMYMAYVEMWIR